MWGWEDVEREGEREEDERKVREGEREKMGRMDETRRETRKAKVLKRDWKGSGIVLELLISVSSQGRVVSLSRPSLFFDDPLDFSVCSK